MINESESSKHHSEYFVVNYSEVTPGFGPNEVGVTLLIVYYFDGTLYIVRVRKVAARIAVGVAVIRNV